RDEIYNVACELALCAASAAKGPNGPPDPEAVRRLADQAMAGLGRSVLEGVVDTRHMQRDTDLEILWPPDAFRAPVRSGPEVGRANRSVRERSRSAVGGGGQVRAAVLTPDGRHALARGTDGTLRLVDVGEGREVRRIEGFGRVLRLALTPDRTRAVVAGF